MYQGLVTYCEPRIGLGPLVTMAMLLAVYALACAVVYAMTPVRDVNDVWG